MTVGEFCAVIEAIGEGGLIDGKPKPDNRTITVTWNDSEFARLAMQDLVWWQLEGWIETEKPA